MASVQPYRNPSGNIVWRVQYRVDGKGKQETFEHERGAHEFGKLVDRIGGKAAHAVLDRRRNKTVDVPTLREWTTRYLDASSGILTGIEVGTRAGYESMARGSFLEFLGDYPVDAIERTDVGKWVEWQERQPSKRTKGKPIAAKTVRNYHALLSNIFTAAQEAGLCAANPARGARLSRGLSREGVMLSREEFARVYAEIPDYYKPLVYFLTASQARWSEATALTWADVNTDTIPATVRIAKAWKKNPGGTPIRSVTKTERGRRTVAVGPDVISLLGARGRPAELVFQGKLNHERVWYSGFNERVWTPAVARSGIEKRPHIHDLRHTGASWLIADGAPPNAVQRRLGHEKITTTMDIYSHLMADAQTRMATSLSGVMDGALPALTSLTSRPVNDE